MITVITPTGDRPLAFSLLRKWISNQTIKPDQHIIVDDGKIPMQIEDLQSYEFYIRREPLASDPKHTLVVNIKTALEDIKTVENNKIIICEDDEYYAPNYIFTMAKKLEDYQIVGITCAKYYHLPTGGYEQHKNIQHASLAETAFQSSFLPIVGRCIDKGMEQRWLDDNIWREVLGKKISHDLFLDKEQSLYCGIKGLPGRFGIGIGHNPKVYKKHDDIQRSKLKEWIPNDYQYYLNVLANWDSPYPENCRKVRL